ncbi:phage terminase large subunit [Sphaerisporangium krabiense]|uniref:PBSX family phage terminase large subunit n=1 Tax=Sphaerisporangium krabiense TaxID=763782 RepID=A0A7W8Z3B4_9ACTN|nr:PBSX family phage terminase large subunit [Sphaerisporangium krabiense]MBB5626636.1 PBSX family phage terminase large subunit [Sphaerisporangium krabiense]GII63558.1 phage terminase large subunit [Sphaerisporangium krabiense]
MLLDAVTRVLSPKQIRSVVGAQTTPQIALWSGAVSSGKTIASLLAFLIALLAAPDHGLVVIVGRTLQTIERNIIDPLQSSHLFGMLAGQIHHTTGSTTAVILGRTVHLIGAADARAEGRIRGATIGLAYVDEATLLPQSFWMMLLSRLRVPGAKMLATTNPDGPGHWLKRDFIARAAEIGMRHWHFSLDDNPSLEPSYIARLKAQYVGLWYRRFIEGAWCLAEGAIYEMFDDQHHVTDDLPAIDRWFSLGIDYGTVNPFAALAVGLGEDRRLHVVAEYRHDSRTARRQLTDGEYSRELRAWLALVERPREQGKTRGIQPERIYVDPSAASFMTQLWSDKVPSVSAANNSVIDGIRTVSTLLGADQLRIHHSCEGLLAELPGYSWDDKAAEKGEDKPLKVDDHSCDALRYALHSSAWLWRPLVRPALSLAA